MTGRRPIIITHLYPRDMNIYGDYGNVATLVKRLEWRGYETVVEPVEVGRRYDFGRSDLIFGGGGQDIGQVIVGADLLGRGAELRAAALDGLPMLLICGLYQLFGHEFRTVDERTIPGIGVFDARTVGGPQRLTGNIVIDSPFGRLVGFENHSGQTELFPGQRPLGQVITGFGNAAKGGQEGAIAGEAIGSYLHGPILPKNPALADHLLLTALRRRHPGMELEPLDDRLEREAATIAARRPR